MGQRRFVCHSCGSQVQHSAEEPPCQVLSGWFMVSLWGEPGKVVHYTFCCASCLKAWIDARVPRVPDVFLKAFDKREN